MTDLAELTPATFPLGYLDQRALDRSVDAALLMGPADAGWASGCEELRGTATDADLLARHAGAIQDIVDSRSALDERETYYAFRAIAMRCVIELVAAWQREQGLPTLAIPRPEPDIPAAIVEALDGVETGDEGASRVEIDQIRPPWTRKQVDALNRYQIQGNAHPFTCPNRGDDAHESGKTIDGSGLTVALPYRGNLIATADGWVCPCCTYRQDWAHAAMLQD